MNSSFARFVLRYATVFARLAVAAVFLSNVADRFGLWRAAGTGSVAALLIVTHDDFPLSVDAVRSRAVLKPGLLIVVATLVVLTGCGGMQASSAGGASSCDLVGAWEPVSLRFTDPDGTVRDVEIGDPPGLKILSETRWAFVEEGSGDQGPTSGGGGTYTIDGDTYTEFVEYHGATSFVGEAIAFDCRTENGRWYQSGELPSGTYLEEVYRRLD